MYLVNAMASAFSCRQTVLAVILICFAIGLSGCSDSDGGAPFVPFVDPNDVVPDPTQDSIAVTLNNRMDYGTLLRLIEDASLVDALQGDNMGMGWTLFAPSDAAFGDETFASITSEQQVGLAALHLYSGRLAFEDLTPGALSMSEGSVEITQNENGLLSVGGATIVARDRVVGNGIIHFVDAVLDPLQ